MCQKPIHTYSSTGRFGSWSANNACAKPAAGTSSGIAIAKMRTRRRTVEYVLI